MSATVQPAEKIRVATRVQSVDILRGAVMIVMALDHVRDFFHSAAQQFSPTDLSRTSAVLFFTRWITHFCAPVFMFSAGLSAFFWGRGKTKAQLSRFLWTRGLWLVFLELTLMQFALFFRTTYNPVILNVLWALGCSMIALALLVYLP
ncbi:MAG TPA: heparan-alpha-glucosaminide N-acetyltransferase domain-containing protein, partial [Bryobacteraceae bacterium]|nr:heparan-alpha-glucosaminide N-acetyltransferase domain-containing protein [Bryobacteraceae bacterium]